MPAPRPRSRPVRASWRGRRPNHVPPDAARSCRSGRCRRRAPLHEPARERPSPARPWSWRIRRHQPAPQPFDPAVPAMRRWPREAHSPWVRPTNRGRCPAGGNNSPGPPTSQNRPRRSSARPPAAAPWPASRRHAPDVRPDRPRAPHRRPRRLRTPPDQARLRLFARRKKPPLVPRAPEVAEPLARRRRRPRPGRSQAGAERRLRGDRDPPGPIAWQDRESGIRKSSSRPGGCPTPGAHPLLPVEPGRCSESRGPSCPGTTSCRWETGRPVATTRRRALESTGRTSPGRRCSEPEARPHRRGSVAGANL